MHSPKIQMESEVRARRILAHTFQDSHLKPTTPHTTQETQPMYKSEGKNSILLIPSSLSRKRERRSWQRDN